MDPADDKEEAAVGAAVDQDAGSKERKERKKERSHKKDRKDKDKDKDKGKRSRFVPCFVTPWNLLRPCAAVLDLSTHKPVTQPYWPAAGSVRRLQQLMPLMAVRPSGGVSQQAVRL